MTGESCRPAAGRPIFGSVVVLLGVLLFLRGLHVAAAQIALHWLFPAALLTLGAARLLRPGRIGRSVGGWISVAFGGYLAARQLGVPMPGELWDFVWPALLIAAGIAIVRQSLRTAPSPAAPAEPGAAEDAEARVSHTAVLAGQEIRRTSSSFAGGSLTAVCGGCSLDLTAARTAPAGATLDVLAVCGGIAIRVPQGWEVVSEVTPVLGGFEDKTRRIPGSPSTGSLTIRGSAILGGVEVSN